MRDGAVLVTGSVRRGAEAGGMGGVFVNYRSRDQPVAAAAIHATLVGRFGAARVFRDCVALEAGEHYPSVIRDALERADVLVAVIGPRWLTLTEERTAIRLIDREHDWVRNEIARALQRGIPIVPVLLQDTPEHAKPPLPAELPADIRPLAALQALEISHRRFGDDLTRLADRLLRLVPTLTEPPPPAAVPAHRATGDPQLDAFAELVEVFLTVPSVRDHGGRRRLLDLIRPEIATLVPNHTSDRMHVIALLRTCLQYHDGLTELIEAVRALGHDGAHIDRLRSIASRLSATMDKN